MLIEHEDVAVHSIDSNGWTPLSLAVEKGETNAWMLLECGNIAHAANSEDSNGTGLLEQMGMNLQWVHTSRKGWDLFLMWTVLNPLQKKHTRSLPSNTILTGIDSDGASSRRAFYLFFFTH
jgi:hypothetical protein